MNGLFSFGGFRGGPTISSGSFDRGTGQHIGHNTPKLDAPLPLVPTEPSGRLTRAGDSGSPLLQLPPVLERVSVPGSEVTLYGPTAQAKAVLPRPKSPLRVAFLTSIRDVGEAEGVGRTHAFRDNSDPRYLKGTIEAVLDSTREGSLRGYAQVVAIITDDLPKDLARSPYTAHPRSEGDWIFPRDVQCCAGRPAERLVHNVPSAFRLLPRGAREDRAREKLAFETAVHDVMMATGADVLVSDHYLAQIAYLIRDDHFGLYGRVLNTHPGITRHDHHYRCIGKDPYAIAVSHASGVKDSTDGPRFVSPHGWTGASFHLVNERIDDGPVLCDAELTPVSPDDSPDAVCHRNYKLSKNAVCITGLKYYASHFHPRHNDVEWIRP